MGFPRWNDRGMEMRDEFGKLVAIKAMADMTEAIRIVATLALKELRLGG